MIVYLAGPIDLVSSEEAKGWREELVLPPGVLTVSPAHGYRGATLETAPDVDRVCRAMIRASDWVLANLCGEGLAVGTIREIEYAKSLGKLVVVAWPLDREVPFMLHDTVLAPSPQDAMLTIEM